MIRFFLTVVSIFTIAAFCSDWRAFSKEIKKAITILLTLKLRAGHTDMTISCIEVATMAEDCKSMVTVRLKPMPGD